MYAHKPLAAEDLALIASFPQSADELFYVSPRFRYPLTPEQIMLLLENRHSPTVVVEEGSGSVAGYANLYETTEESCWLGNLIVAPRYRGTGAAGTLIAAMMDQARSDHRAKRMHLSCHQTNARGLAFYHKQGSEPFDLKIVPVDPKGSLITIHMGIEL